jgi:DNA-binding CsgD family transcriptional regulator
MPDEDDNLVEGPLPSLTEEEARVMKLVSEGRTTQEVADELGISPPTVAENEIKYQQTRETGRLIPA